MPDTPVTQGGIISINSNSSSICPAPFAFLSGGFLDLDYKPGNIPALKNIIALWRLIDNLHMRHNRCHLDEFEIFFYKTPNFTLGIDSNSGFKGASDEFFLSRPLKGF